jgi:hypothetical protein
MYFPWVGLFEQIRLADVFVHYNDVQLTKGFYNRVQVKTPHGIKWLTIPLQKHHQSQHIDQVRIDDNSDWRSQHRDILRQAYLKSPFRDEMLKLVDRVFAVPAESLADVSRASMMEIAGYFQLLGKKQFVNSNSLGIDGSSSQRLRDMVLALNANIYITGHGARNYLDHEIFERSNIAVQYMKYRCIPYRQLHGDFTPYVTALDLIANCGKEGTHLIQSEAVEWKIFLEEKI